MRLTTLFFFLALFQVSANSYSQETRLNLKFQNETLESVFNKIEANSEFSIFYKNELLKNSELVNGEFSNALIFEILDKVLKSGELTYTIKDKLIMIIPKEEGNRLNNQQQKQVIGTVKDETGQPIPGATVLVKGTTIGIVTDADGKYTLDIPANGQSLIFSFVGMQTSEVTIGNQTTINVSLREETIGLEEVVAVGYGTQSKRNVTGSIQSVSSDQIADMPVTTVAQKLQGKLSGVQINQTTGKPGQGMQVRIRGQASLTASNDPLYVVDGFPIVGDISSINPNEIESLSVLKDASSTALYGSRAANGVILVTTKRAKVGKTSVGVTSYYGWQEVPQRGRPDMMNGTEFAQFKKESYEARGLSVPAAFQNPAQYGEGYNYYDALLRVAPIQDYSVSLSTSKENFSTTAVLGVFDQNGVVLNSDYKRYSVRLNSEFKITEKIKAGINVAPTYSLSNSPNTDGIFWSNGLINNALTIWPIFPYKNEDGTMPMNFFDQASGSYFQNYYRSAQMVTNETKNLRLMSNAFVQYEPIPGLTLKSSFNADYGDSKSVNISPSTVGAVVPTTATGRFRTNKYLTWLNENTITYKKSLGEHNFEWLGGATIQKFREDALQISYSGFSDDRVPTLNAAQNIVRGSDWLTGIPNTYNDIQEWSMISYLSRLNYNFKNKYLLSAAIRSDGSSRFGKDNRWGNFPSASVGWIASEENFLKNFKALSLLKIRASYGVVGNNNIGNYTQYATVSTGSNNYNAIFGSSLYSGSALTSLPNSTLTWEQTGEYDLGFDVSFFNNRISAGYDYYNRKTKSMLYGVRVAQESGFSNFMANVGELQFWGHEISINTQNLTGKLKWNTEFNISFTDNRVNELTGLVDRIYSGLFESAITKVGQKVGLFYGMVWDGVYDNQAEFNSSPKAVASEVGTIKFKDMNNDDVITHGGDNDDRTVIGDPTPTFTFGFSNSLAYKNFDLSIVTAGSYGSEILKRMEQSITNLDGNFNVLKELQGRWRSEANPGNGKYGKTTSGTANERDWVSSRFVSKADYLTIKNVTLGYTLPKGKIKGVSSLRLYCSIQQLYTFTNYDGMNPEISTTLSGTMANALDLGNDYGGFPVPRTISFGINLGL